MGTAAVGAPTRLKPEEGERSHPGEQGARRAVPKGPPPALLPPAAQWKSCPAIEALQRPQLGFASSSPSRGNGAAQLTRPRPHGSARPGVGSVEGAGACSLSGSPSWALLGTEQTPGICRPCSLVAGVSEARGAQENQRGKSPACCQDIWAGSRPGHCKGFWLPASSPSRGLWRESSQCQMRCSAAWH